MARLAKATCMQEVVRVLNLAQTNKIYLKINFEVFIYDYV